MHEAHHGLATRLMETGAEAKVITAPMGPSAIVTSRGYQHVGAQHALEAVERIAVGLQLAGNC